MPGVGEDVKQWVLTRTPEEKVVPPFQGTNGRQRSNTEGLQTMASSLLQGINLKKHSYEYFRRLGHKYLFIKQKQI